ncbi:hypothetical protein RvY_17486 [Ramazzottius varieornatus]|uniref:Uncharacterized protein n=1 Tax=Ramazzottius varieornatus TaxID=947166 RepID=A0A1D1W291_RAMVA|nr:hypothetical protein RvY_17486 [Ramazzottius varieornatus]
MEMSGILLLGLIAVASANFAEMGMSMGGDNSMNMQQKQQQGGVFLQQSSQLSGGMPIVAQCLECDDKDSSNVVRVLVNKKANVDSVSSNQGVVIMPAAVQGSGAGFDMLLDSRMLNAVPPPQNLLTTTIFETFLTNYQGIPVTGKRTRISVYYANQAVTAAFAADDNRATPMYQSNPGQMLVYYSNNDQQASFNGGQQGGMAATSNPAQPQPALFVHNPQPPSFSTNQQPFTAGSSFGQDTRSELQSANQSPTGSGLFAVNVVAMPSGSAISSNQDGINIQFPKTNQGASAMACAPSSSNSGQFVSSAQNVAQFGSSGQNMGQSSSAMTSSGSNVGQFVIGSTTSRSNSGMTLSAGSNINQPRVTSAQASSGQSFGQSSGGMVSSGSNVGQFGLFGGQSNSGQRFGQSNSGMMLGGSSNVGQLGVSNQLAGQGTSNMFSVESVRSSGSNVAVTSASSSQSGSQLGTSGSMPSGGRNLDTASSQGNLLITSPQNQNGASMQSSDMSAFQGLTPQASRDRNTFISPSNGNVMTSGGGYQSISAYNIQGTDGFVTVGSVTFVAAAVGSPFTTVTDIRTISPTINQPPGSFMTSSSRLEAFFAPVSNTRVRGERTRFAYYYVLGDANTAGLDQRNARISSASTSFAAVNDGPTPVLTSVPQVVYQGSGRSGEGSDFNQAQQVNQVNQPTNQQQGSSQSTQNKNVQQVNPFGQPLTQQFGQLTSQQGSVQGTNQPVNQISQPNSQQFSQGSTQQVNQGANQDLFAGTSQQVPRVVIVPAADTFSQQVQSTAQPTQINLQNIQGQSFTNQQRQLASQNQQSQSSSQARQGQSSVDQFGSQTQNTFQPTTAQSSPSQQEQLAIQNQQGQMTVQSSQGPSGNQQGQSALQASASQGQSAVQMQQGSGAMQSQQGQASSSQQSQATGNSQSGPTFSFAPSQPSTDDQMYNAGLIDMSSGTTSKNTLNIVSLPANQASGRSSTDNVNVNSSPRVTSIRVAPSASLSNANSNIQLASVGTAFNMSDQSAAVNNGASAQSVSDGSAQNRAMLVFNPTNMPIQFGNGLPMTTQSFANGTNAVALSSASSSSSAQGANTAFLQSISSSQGNFGANFRHLRSLKSSCDGSGFCRITEEQ